MAKSKKNKKNSATEASDLADSPANQFAEMNEILPESEEAAEIVEHLASEAELQDIMDAEFGESEMNVDVNLFKSEEEASESFLPEVADDQVIEEVEEVATEVELSGTELDNFEAADIVEVEFVEDERLSSIIESVLFASDRPVSMNSLKLLFQGTNIKTDMIRRTLDSLAVEYAGGTRGISLEEVNGGYQLRTKIDNMEFLRRTLKTRPFKLSGPALETLAIVAYKQPLIKHEIDEIRGVESGHLLRALMEKGIVNFEGKSDLPGRPMQYGTTKKFLEIFGLRSLKELPTLSQIDELLPEGIGEDEESGKQTLSDITSSMSEGLVSTYSTGEEELTKIQNQLEEISTSTEFFEQEKKREQAKRQQEKAQGIREALLVNEKVPTRDMNWLKKYDEAIAAGHAMLEIEWPFQKKKNVNPAVDTNAAIEQFETETAIEQFEAESIGEQSESEVAIAETDSDGDSEVEFDSDELPFYGEADEIDEKNEAEV